jgi:hypothetical protein
MIDQNGNFVALYLYEPYGKLLAASGPLAQKNRLQFSGKNTTNPAASATSVSVFMSPPFHAGSPKIPPRSSTVQISTPL